MIMRECEVICAPCQQQDHNNCLYPEAKATEAQPPSCFCHHRETERMADGTIACVVNGEVVTRDVR